MNDILPRVVACLAAAVTITAFLALRPAPTPPNFRAGVPAAMSDPVGLPVGLAQKAEAPR